MDYQELLRKYIVERQASEQKLIGGEVIELTLFASWLNKNASQQSFAPDAPPETCEHGNLPSKCPVEICSYSKHGGRR